MDKLPNMDEFTIELCYKILRSENRLDEPKCKWGNDPHDTDIEISDDIQRLINATNSIKNIKSEEVTEKYSEKFLKEIELIVTRGDTFLQQGFFGSLYNSLSRSEIDSFSILQELTRVKAIDEPEFLPDTESEMRERYSRLAMSVIDTFPNILRDVIRSNISAGDLYLQCINYIGDFNSEQQANLRQLQYSNTYSSLDVTLICRLLRQFKLIPPPTQGWGTFPNIADTTLADDIERIRCYRNQIAHRCDINIDANMFDDYFDKFQHIGHRMDLKFFHKTNFELQIIGNRTRRIDTKMLKKYENALKEIENIQLRLEKKPIKFYWGRSFDECLMNLRLLIKEEKIDGKQKVRLQIIFQNENDVETTINILNSLKDEINKDLSGIEFIVATKGSIILIVDILVEMLETDETLMVTLDLFRVKILESITSSITESIDIVLMPAEEYTYLHNSTTIREPVYIDFDIDAELFVIDDVMELQISKISDAISKCINGDGKHKDITATPLPINHESCAMSITTRPDNRPFEVPLYRPSLQCGGVTTPPSGSGGMEWVTSQPTVADHDRQGFSNVQKGLTGKNTTITEDAFTQPQTPVKYNLPVSVTLCKKLNMKELTNERLTISVKTKLPVSGTLSPTILSCIKIGNTLVFTDRENERLIICNSDGTDVHRIPLSYTPYCITEIDSNTVAVSCSDDCIILIINISTRYITSTIEATRFCGAISYNDNNLYVVIDVSILHVMDLTGKVIRTIPLPSEDRIWDITVDRDRLVCIDWSSIYCCSLDGKLMWKFKMDKFQDLRGLTTDIDGNVYVTDRSTHTVTVVSDDGQHHRELLTKSDGLDKPWGIYFDKTENSLLVSNKRDGNAFLFDAIKKLT